MEPQRLPPLPTPAPLGTWIFGFASLAMLLLVVFTLATGLGIPAAWPTASESSRVGLEILATVGAAWIFQMVFAVFEQDRRLFFESPNAQVIDRGMHGRQHWYELTDGIRTAPEPPAPTLDPVSQLTPSGFELVVPNRRTTVRTFTRLLSTAAAITLMLLAIIPSLSRLLGDSLPLSVTAIVALVLPGATLAAVRAHLRDRHRTRGWTDRIRLDGVLVATDAGRITLQPGFTVERFEDRSGSGVEIRSGSEKLRFRAAWSALEWAVPRLRLARPAQGNAEEVPEALRRRRAAVQ